VARRAGREVRRVPPRRADSDGRPHGQEPHRGGCRDDGREGQGHRRRNRLVGVARPHQLGLLGGKHLAKAGNSTR